MRDPARPVRRRSLRRRWNVALSVLLGIVVLTALAITSFADRVVGTFESVTHRLHETTHLTAELRSDVTEHEHTAHAVMLGVPFDHDAFVAQQRAIEVRFAKGAEELQNPAHRASLAAAADLWRRSLVNAGIWGEAAARSRSERTDAARLAQLRTDVRHVRITEETFAVLDRLDELAEAMHVDVDAELARASRVRDETERLLTVLFLLAVGAVVYFGRQMRRDVLRPIATLQSGAARLESGHLDERVVLPARSQRSEVGALADAFNTMAGAIETSQRQRASLLKRAMDVREEERTSVAHELHDGPIQRLAALTYLIDVGVMKDHREPGTARDTFYDVRDRLAAEVEGLRRLMSDLRPPVLDQGGIAAGIADHADEFTREHRIGVTLDVDTGEARFDPAVETVVYRLVQEALTNVRKHTRARIVAVSIHHTGESIEVAVADDGDGFDPHTVSRGDGHFGLATMAERVASVGGTFGVDSAPGAGTVVSASIPVAAERTAPEVPAPRAAVAVTSVRVSGAV